MNTSTTGIHSFVRNRGHGQPLIAGLDAPACRHHRAAARDGPDQFGGISLMSIHRSHICHIGGVDQGHFSHPPRNSRSAASLRATQTRPTTTYGGWLSCPSWKAASLPASHPHRQPAPPASRQLLNTESNRKGRDGGVACPICRASRRGSHRRMRAHQGRVNAGMVGDDVKERPDNFSDT